MEVSVRDSDPAKDNKVGKCVAHAFVVNQVLTQASKFAGPEGVFPLNQRIKGKNDYLCIESMVAVTNITKGCMYCIFSCYKLVGQQMQPLLTGIKRDEVKTALKKHSHTIPTLNFLDLSSQEPFQFLKEKDSTLHLSDLTQLFSHMTNQSSSKLFCVDNHEIFFIGAFPHDSHFYLICKESFPEILTKIARQPCIDGFKRIAQKLHLNRTEYASLTDDAQIAEIERCIKTNERTMRQREKELSEMEEKYFKILKQYDDLQKRFKVIESKESCLRKRKLEM